MKPGAVMANLNDCVHVCTYVNKRIKSRMHPCQVTGVASSHGNTAHTGQQQNYIVSTKKTTTNKIIMISTSASVINIIHFHTCFKNKTHTSSFCIIGRYDKDSLPGKCTSKNKHEEPHYTHQHQHSHSQPCNKTTITSSSYCTIIVKDRRN